ncbi:hypothetical protein BU23DRAFT_570145 [Bimuria novae-zelandiae CBS 107.79]|uniref:Uncharacterized protein n=1 Tax=Bimuria novae-zelandiae CBS 107.79 TaxID=1447943 RepID=A0A6A5V221_9PLEO|nr:hypothetical protein BU23DRAFT_570145 [Bimuria novae-zelandiae CBS 107.79]
MIHPCLNSIKPEAGNGISEVESQVEKWFLKTENGAFSWSSHCYMDSNTANPLCKAMSYPGLLPDSDPKKDYVTFSVPNHKVIRRITKNLEDDENLRVQVSGKVLGKKLDEIAILFKRYEIESSPIEGHQELRVRLYVPKPPEPRSTLAAKGDSGDTHESQEAPARSMKPSYVIHEPSRFRTKVGQGKMNASIAVHQRRTYFIDQDSIEQPRDRLCLHTIKESILEA